MFRLLAAALLVFALTAPGRAELRLITFGGKWCPFCVQMEREVWPTPAVQQALKRRQLTRQQVDPRQSRMSAQARNAWQVDIVPTTILVDVTADGKGAKEVGRIVGAQPAAAVVRLIERAKQERAP